MFPVQIAIGNTTLSYTLMNMFIHLIFSIEPTLKVSLGVNFKLDWINWLMFKGFAPLQFHPIFQKAVCETRV